MISADDKREASKDTKPLKHNRMAKLARAIETAPQAVLGVSL